MSVAPDLLLRDNTLVVSVLAEGTDPRAWNCPVAEGPIPLLPQADDPYTWPRFGGAFPSVQTLGTISRVPGFA